MTKVALMTKVTLPEINSLESVKILAVSVEVGDTVKEGQALFDVEISDAIVKLFSAFDDGVVQHIYVTEGETVTVNQMLMDVEAEWLVDPMLTSKVYKVSTTLVASSDIETSVPHVGEAIVDIHTNLKTNIPDSETLTVFCNIMKKYEVAAVFKKNVDERKIDWQSVFSGVNQDIEVTKNQAVNSEKDTVQGRGELKQKLESLKHDSESKISSLAEACASHDIQIPFSLSEIKNQIKKTNLKSEDTNKILKLHQNLRYELDDPINSEFRYISMHLIPRLSKKQEDIYKCFFGGIFTFIVIVFLLSVSIDLQKNIDYFILGTIVNLPFVMALYYVFSYIYKLGHRNLSNRTHELFNNIVNIFEIAYKSKLSLEKYDKKTVSSIRSYFKNQVDSFETTKHHIQAKAEKQQEEERAWAAQHLLDAENAIENLSSIVAANTYSWTEKKLSIPPNLHLGSLHVSAQSIPIAVQHQNPFNLLITSTDNKAVDGVQNLLLQMLATKPAGMIKFTFVDPLGIGNSAAPFLKLQDYGNELIGQKVWSDPRQVEAQLDELTEHIEAVVQRYLRGEHSTIEEYNAKAKDLAEPYRVLVFFGVPQDLSHTACTKLLGLAKSGHQCGLKLIILSEELPSDLSWEALKSVQEHLFINEDNGHFKLMYGELKHHPFTFASLPPKETIDELIKQVGEGAAERGRVEIAFWDMLGQEEATLWSRSSLEDLQLPIGMTGARRIHNLTFGQGTTHHGLMAGTTGSGKSNLMHVIASSAAYCYRPGELELYLLDFKQGVEFKPYANFALPHARVVAIQGEREIGVSVLRGLNKEYERRSELFKAQDVANLTYYRKKTGKPLPRILLVMDEFQVLFQDNDALSSEAERLLEQLARLGRGFGIHILLATQTLAGMNNALGQVLSQTNVRIALQCKADDAQLILSPNNTLAVRTLNRPGAAIYNDDAGAEPANTAFQATYLPPEDHVKLLQQLRNHADEQEISQPLYVFDGTSRAQLTENKALRSLQSKAMFPEGRPKESRVVLGEPLEIKEATEGIFRREPGRNLSVLCKDETYGLGMMLGAVSSVALQHPTEDLTIVVVDFLGDNSEYTGRWQTLSDILPHEVTLEGRRKFTEIATYFAGNIDNCLEKEEPLEGNVLLVLYGLHKARDLRDDEDLLDKLLHILREGGDLGIHTLLWADSYANLTRLLGKQGLKDVDMRVAMTQNLEELRNVSGDFKIKGLKSNQGIFVDVENNVLEKFMPFEVPSIAQLESLEIS